MIDTDVWELYTDCNKDLGLSTDDPDYFRSRFIGESMAAEWEPPEIEILDKRKRVRNFVSWEVSAPVISERAWKALRPLIGPHLELLPLIKLKRNRQYYALNVLTLVDCLDLERSDFTTSGPPENPVVATVHKAAFDPARVQDVPLFKVPQYLGATFVRRPFIDAVQAAGLQGAYFSNPMDPWKQVFDKSPDNIDPLDVPAPETGAPGQPPPTEVPTTLDRTDPPPPLQDRPLTAGEQGEVALCLRNGLARLGLGPDADPLTIVQAIAEGLDRWRKAHPKPSDDDVLMASLDLGPLFGEQLCRVPGWQWVAVLHGEEPLYGVVPEDRARVVYPIVWFGTLTRNRRLKNNLVLVFNMVKLGRLPAAAPGSYREVR